MKISSTHLQASHELVKEVRDDAIAQSLFLHDVAQILGYKRHHHVAKDDKHQGGNMLINQSCL